MSLFIQVMSTQTVVAAWSIIFLKLDFRIVQENLGDFPVLEESIGCFPLKFP